MKSMLDVFENEGGETSFSRHTFYGVMSAFTIYGLVGSAIAAYLTSQSGFQPSWVSIILLGLIVPIVGIIIAARSTNWFISFIGYNMVLIPFGIILAPVLKAYDPDVVQNACALTAGITVIMGIAGVMFPNFFSKIGGALFIVLFGLLIVRILAIFIPELQVLSWIDYVAAGIFSLYIGYDMWRASEVECTMDNAVDIALSLYLDIINLFLNILKIMGGKSDD